MQIVDYETKPLSREKIRTLVKVIRKIFNIKNTKFPVLKVLDMLEKDGVIYVVEDDKKFKKNVMAYLEPTNEGYCIHIRNSVYDGACEGEGKCLGYICHEECHFFLIEYFGFKPIYGRSMKDRIIPACRSMEWQAKAMCGELMIPIEECYNMSIEEIMITTNSSYQQSEYFASVTKDK